MINGYTISQGGPPLRKLSYGDALDVAYYFLLDTQKNEHWREVKEQIDKVLNPLAPGAPHADDDLMGPLSAEKSGKVGIDLTTVSDIGALFDDFDVG